MTELREKMIRTMELKNLSPSTVKGYLTSITTLSKHYKKSPDKITHEMVEDFLLYLKNDKELATDFKTPANCPVQLPSTQTIRLAETSMFFTASTDIGQS